ncbi:conjugal transfer protein TrbG [Rubellimicrobium roseum]|uniref:Conjugal transfer protein TrbG n=2 Tax=Rubellimicrobium roseum TaxID=687525 RepID=A0A5C4N6B6_9RHOB|nr:TrbG/VirB9 family P-type conjugative transfer protein [Rubellimicrobium roseum]TNC66273.1 conjugal transfer protein TrbG [Rubellimicrobium roseum]
MGPLGRLGLVLGLALALASGALAEVTPSRGAYDEHVRVASYVDGQVYRLNTTLLHVTTVEFAPGESIRSIVAGDTEGFQFDGIPGGQAFAVKPTMSGVRTNITVYTNLRSYYFNVVEVNGPTHYVVRFSYPGASAAPQNAIARAAPNYRYGANGETEFTPTAVWDDGTFTYFQFASNAPLPAVLRVGAEGNERTVNSTTQTNGVVRVSGVNTRWVLRLGEQVVCVQALEGTS